MERRVLIPLLWLMIGSGLAAQGFVVVYNESFSPFSWVESGEVVGIEVDLMDDLARRLGVNVTHRALPWARAQNEVASGAADAFITAPTSERQDYSDMSYPSFAVIHMVAVASRANPALAQLSKLKTLVDTRQYSQVNYFGSGWAAANLKSTQVHYLKSTEAVYQFLLAGRAQLFIDADISVSFNAMKLNLRDQIQVLPAVLDSIDLRLGISKKSRLLAQQDKIRAALDAMLADGTVTRVLAKYGHNP